MNARDAILLGIREATATHDAFRIREHVEGNSAPVDVFGAIVESGASLLFRPLDGLLGACLRLGEGDAGILVTTRRSLHMQRFTAAHELGHLVLEHEGSLDREVRYPGQTANRDLNEVAADAFAGEFLMPKWLIKHHAKRHEWSTQHLRDPLIVYQLSLRMAVSYEAACWGLLGHRILDDSHVEALRRVAPKKTKQRILGDLELDDWRAHAWLIDERDHSSTLEAGQGDLFVVNLAENAGGGYLWEIRAIEEAGFTILDDLGIQETDGLVGGPTRRRMLLRSPPPGFHRLELEERRPWERTRLRSLTISVSSFGAESDGLPRRQRPMVERALLH